MELDPSDDVAILNSKLCLSINKTIELTNQLRDLGGVFNSTKIDIIRAESKEDIRTAKIAHQEAEGKYKEIQALIRCQKEITMGIKTLLKAEKGGF
jgi:hypothetical protein